MPDHPARPLFDCPRRIAGRSGGGSGPESDFVLCDDLYAIHGRTEDEPAPGAVLVLSRGRVAIYRGRPDRAKDPAVGPVYSAENAPPSVPTGRAFVRFTAGTDAASRASDLAAAGYVVENVPVSAPHAAWVTHRSGRIAEGLNGLRALARIPGVENVEPELLQELARR